MFLGCSEIKTPRLHPLTKVSGLISDIITDIIIDIRHKGEFLFAVRDGTETSPAYLSIVRTQKEGLNYAINACELLACPWYSNLDSSKVLDRLAMAKKRVYIGGLESQSERHPLAL